MTPTQRLIPLADRQGWTSALDGVPHAFGHTWESCHAISLTTGLPTLLYVWQTPSGRVVCPLSERAFRGFPDIVTPFGFSGFASAGDTAGMPADWREFAKLRGYVCGYIVLNPLCAPIAGFDAADIHHHNDLFVLDLRQPEDALFAALSRNRQRQVKAYREGSPMIAADRQRNAAFLLEHYAAFFRQKRANAAHDFSVATLTALLGLPNTLLFGAVEAGEIRAVWLFTFTPHIAESFMTVSVADGGAHATALTWHGLLALQRLGIPFLNLGGGVVRGDGIARYKQRYGPLELPLRALKQVYRPLIYEELCRAAGVDPHDRGGFFPAYHRHPVAGQSDTARSSRDGPAPCT